MKYADLHTHTIYSDGTYTPHELFSLAQSSGLSAVAVTDHDSVEAIPECIEASEETGVELVSGIELTSEADGCEIHILGFLLEHKNPRLIKELKVLKKNREERVYKMIEKLKGHGITLSPDSVFGLAGCGGTVGRLHIARAMAKEKIVGSVYEAFHKYIGDKCPCYVLGFRFSPLQAIKLIKEAGGVPVLAHPYLVRSKEAVRECIKHGIMGLEAYYPEHTSSMVNNYLKLAKKHHLLVTGGSDFHGKAKADVKLGCVKFPYINLEKLRQARETLVGRTR